MEKVWGNTEESLNGVITGKLAIGVVQLTRRIPITAPPSLAPRQGQLRL